ncbi:MAG: hypothetical protein E6G34_01965 [Actinobacteria bacterium]|nr:MAG: hypothetical protein E6G34_01965 [Actinomycetota bacterium]
MSELDLRAYCDAVLRVFQRQGWRDPDDAASAITLAVAASDTRTIDAVDIGYITPRDFLERNQIDAQRLRRALSDALSGTRIGSASSDVQLLRIDEIDSFATVRAIDARAVAAFSTPLQINERVIKHCVHTVIGDPYIGRDWGGERSDIESDRVQLGGRRVASAFLLKGRSVQGPLYGSELGKRGDQIVRLLSQRAQLSVVQHVHEVPNETRDQLRYGVIALRTTGAVPNAQASVWDGVDTARLLLAAGYIGTDGTLTEIGQQADDQLRSQSG